MREPPKPENPPPGGTPPPLIRLLRYAGGHRGRILAATSFSILNKIFDLAPPLLIGTAVDVVVRRGGRVDAEEAARAGGIDAVRQAAVAELVRLEAAAVEIEGAPGAEIVDLDRREVIRTAISERRRVLGELVA